MITIIIQDLGGTICQFNVELTSDIENIKLIISKILNIDEIYINLIHKTNILYNKEIKIDTLLDPLQESILYFQLIKSTNYEIGLIINNILKNHYSKECNEYMKTNKNFTLKVLFLYKYCIEYMYPDVIKNYNNDYDFMFLIIQISGLYLLFANETLKYNETLILLALKTKPYEILEMLNKNNLHFDFLLNYDFIKSIIQIDGLILKWVDSKFRYDKILSLLAVKNNALSIQYCLPLPCDDEEIMTIVITKGYHNAGTAIQFASKRLQEDKQFVKLALSINGISLQYLSKTNILLHDIELLQIAIKNTPYVFSYICSYKPEIKHKSELKDFLKSIDIKLYNLYFTN